MKREILLKTTLFLFYLLASSVLYAQSWDHLSQKKKNKIITKEKKWFPHTELTLADSSILKGHIISVLDHGIYWRSGPNLPGYDSTIHFLPASRIRSYHIDQSGQPGYHLMGKSIAVGVVSTSLLLPLYSSFDGASRFEIEGKGMALGMIAGIVTGLVYTAYSHKNSRSNLLSSNPFSRIEKLKLQRGALYSQRRFLKMSREWVTKDSLLIGRPFQLLEPKLYPVHQGLKLEVGIAIGQANLFDLPGRYGKRLRIEVPVEIDGAQKGSYQMAYTEGRPAIIEIRAFYRINPRLKLGIQTLKTNDTRDAFGIRNEFIDGNGDVIIKHKALGLVAEYHPFPIKYLRLRRWDGSLGLGLFGEAVAFSHDIRLGHPNGQVNLSPRETFIKPALLGYTGISYQPLPFLSFQTRLGFYQIGKLKSAGFSVEYPEPYPDLEFLPQEIKLSRIYYTFGVMLRI